MKREYVEETVSWPGLNASSRVLRLYEDEWRYHLGSKSWFFKSRLPVAQYIKVFLFHQVVLKFSFFSREKKGRGIRKKPRFFSQDSCDVHRIVLCKGWV